VAEQEVAGSVGAVDLKPVVDAAVSFDKSDVVEHRPDVEQLGVVLQALAIPLQHPEGEDSERVVV
jgi:hypothetical protein